MKHIVIFTPEEIKLLTNGGVVEAVDHDGVKTEYMSEGAYKLLIEPPVEEPKRKGHWIRSYDPMANVTSLRCSECGHVRLYNRRMEFEIPPRTCPACGIENE